MADLLASLVHMPQTSPIASLCLLLGVILGLISLSRRKTTSHIPGIRYGSIPGLRSWQGAIAFMRDPNGCLREGHEKYPGGYFKVATISEEHVIVSDSAKVAEYLAAPDENMNAQDAINEGIQFRWTMGLRVYQNTYHIPIIKGKLTQSISSIVPLMQKTIDASWDRSVGDLDDWQEIDINAVLVQMIAKISNVVFGGTPLAEHQEYIDIAIEYAFNLIFSAQLLKPFPIWAKDILQYFTPSYRSKQKAIKLIGGYIQERLDDSKDGKETPSDMLQWLIDSAGDEDRTVPQLVERIIAINVAAIHTSSMTLTTALYVLCGDRDTYLPALQAEIQSASPDGHLTKEALDSMTKLDSFIRECGRLDPIGNIASTRYARRDFRFKDGTFIPAGTHVSGFTAALHGINDPTHDLARFDGFRYSRAAAEQNTRQPQMVSTSLDYLPFGHGKHACPGRFFAAAELKAILARMIARYDMKLIPGTTPKSAFFGFSRIPETKLKILMKSVPL